MDELLLKNSSLVFKKMTPCVQCHGSSTDNFNLSQSSLAHADTFSYEKLLIEDFDPSILKNFKSSSPKQGKLSQDSRNGVFVNIGNELDLLEKATVLEIDPSKLNENHPLAQLHRDFVKEYSDSSYAANKKSTITYGNDYWTHEDRRDYKKGGFAAEATEYGVGIGAGCATAAGLKAAGVTSLMVAGATGLIVGFVVVGGVSYLIHLGIKANDESGVDVTPYIESKGLEASNYGDMPDIPAIAITKKDDYALSSNQAQTQLYVLDEDGMLREIESNVKKGEYFTLNSDKFDLDVTGQRSINEAWSNLVDPIVTENKAKGKETKYKTVFHEGLSLAKDPYSSSKSRTIMKSKLPVIPSSLEADLRNFRVDITDSEGNRINSIDADTVLKSLEFKGIDPKTGKEVFNVNPVYQLIVANKLREAMASNPDKNELQSLATFAAKHLYSMKDRSMHAAREGIDEMDPAKQQYDRLYEHIAVIYAEGVNAMRKRASQNDESLMQPHIRVLSNAVSIAHQYSREVDAKIYGEAFKELNSEKARRLLKDYSYEDKDTLYEQNNLSDFKDWALRNNDKFMELLNEDERFIEGLGLDASTKVEDLSDQQMFQIFAFPDIKTKIVDRQKTKNRVAANLVNWIQKDPTLFKGKAKELIDVLNTKATQGLNDDQIALILGLLNTKRAEIAESIHESVKELRPKTKGGDNASSLINSQNLDKTLNEVLYDLKFIEAPQRNLAKYITDEELKEIIANDSQKHDGFEEMVVSAWLQANKNGDVDTINSGKLEEIMFEFSDQIMGDKALKDHEKKSDLLFAFNDFVRRDPSILEIFKLDKPEFSELSLGGFIEFLKSEGYYEGADNAVIQKDIEETFSYIHKSAKKSPFSGAIYEDLRIKS